jgi:homoserine kinase type II
VDVAGVTQFDEYLDLEEWIRPAVQGGYFAWRCSTDVRTGITDPAENRKGLADARRAFAAADH